MLFFYDTPILPIGFSFPDDYIAIAHEGAKLDPWEFLCNDMATSLLYYGKLLKKFPGRNLVPFAIASDNSGFFNDGWVVLACFDGNEKPHCSKVLIYDYSTPKITPWENKIFSSFGDWLESAKQESLEYIKHSM